MLQKYYVNLNFSVQWFVTRRVDIYLMMFMSFNNNRVVSEHTSLPVFLCVRFVLLNLGLLIFCSPLHSRALIISLVSVIFSCTLLQSKQAQQRQTVHYCSVIYCIFGMKIINTFQFYFIINAYIIAFLLLLYNCRVNFTNKEITNH